MHVHACVYNGILHAVLVIRAILSHWTETDTGQISRTIPMHKYTNVPEGLYFQNEVKGLYFQNEVKGLYFQNEVGTGALLPE